MNEYAGNVGVKEGWVWGTGRGEGRWRGNMNSPWLACKENKTQPMVTCYEWQPLWIVCRERIKLGCLEKNSIGRGQQWDDRGRTNDVGGFLSSEVVIRKEDEAIDISRVKCSSKGFSMHVQNHGLRIEDVVRCTDCKAPWSKLSFVILGYLNKIWLNLIMLKIK